jgi:hypothetical protein
MATTETELLAKLHDAEIDAKEASSAMSHYKDLWIEAETKLVGANIRIARIKEQLRILNKTKPVKEFSHRDEDIAGFRKRYPELCEVWGVWSLTESSWCLLSHTFRIKKEDAEKEMVSFQKTYPSHQYEVRMHHSDCKGHPISDCCQGQ